MSTGKIRCCHKCTERTMSCHTHCGAYLAAAHDLDLAKQEIQKDTRLTNYEVDRARRGVKGNLREVGRRIGKKGKK